MNLVSELEAPRSHLYNCILILHLLIFFHFDGFLLELFNLSVNFSLSARTSTEGIFIFSDFDLAISQVVLRKPFILIWAISYISDQVLFILRWRIYPFVLYIIDLEVKMFRVSCTIIFFKIQRFWRTTSIVMGIIEGIWTWRKILKRMQRPFEFSCIYRALITGIWTIIEKGILCVLHVTRRVIWICSKFILYCLVPRYVLIMTLNFWIQL